MERRAAELDATIASIADGLVIYDLDGRIMRMNPAAERMLGYKATEGQRTIADQLARLHSAGIGGEGKESVEAVLTSAQRMDAMIQELVDATRLEAGQVHLERRPVALRAFIDDLLRRLAGTLETDRVRVSAPAGLPEVLADPDQLERILTNLLSNALKYSPPGSVVTVTLTRRDDEVVTAVSDQGPGIAPEELPHLFERYYRTEAGRERRESLGLGLYITRKLVEAHGGRIWAESEPGKGSTFDFSLPVTKADWV